MEYCAAQVSEHNISKTQREIEPATDFGWLVICSNRWVRLQNKCMYRL